jgi:hypothetical protein
LIALLEGRTFRLTIQPGTLYSLVHNILSFPVLTSNRTDSCISCTSPGLFTTTAGPRMRPVDLILRSSNRFHCIYALDRACGLNVPSPRLKQARECHPQSKKTIPTLIVIATLMHILPCDPVGAVVCELLLRYDFAAQNA